MIFTRERFAKLIGESVDPAERDEGDDRGLDESPMENPDLGMGALNRPAVLDIRYGKANIDEWIEDMQHRDDDEPYGFVVTRRHCRQRFPNISDNDCDAMLRMARDAGLDVDLPSSAMVMSHPTIDDLPAAPRDGAMGESRSVSQSRLRQIIREEVSALLESSSPSPYTDEEYNDKLAALRRRHEEERAKNNERAYLRSVARQKERDGYNHAALGIRPQDPGSVDYMSGYNEALAEFGEDPIPLKGVNPDVEEDDNFPPL